MLIYYDLEKSDLLAPSHEPIIIVLNSFEATSFEGLLKSSANYTGHGTVAGTIIFWSDLDEYDRQFRKPFEGVLVREIIFKIVEVILNYRDYLYYLCVRIKKHVKVRPDEKETLYALAETLRVTYDIKEDFLA